MKRITALTLALALIFSMLAGCNAGGVNNTSPSDNTPIDGTANTTAPTISGGEDITDPTVPGGDDTTDPTVPGGDDTTDPIVPGGDDTADPTVPGGNDEEDKEVVLPSEGIPIDIPKELSENYLYPSASITKFTKNNTGIYENDYVKLDTTKISDGYLIITYKDDYASEFFVYLDETNALSHIFKETHTYTYKKGSYTVGEEIVIKLPTHEAEYYISITSTINNAKSKKLRLNLGLVVVDGAVSLDHIMPGEEKIQLSQTANGVYENEYVKIDTNTANKGYIQIESLDPAAERVEVNLYSNVDNQFGGKGRWHYNHKQKGKTTLKVALTYGNAIYEIEVWTTLTSEALGITRCTRKAVLTVTLNNVSNTGGFLLSTGEVIYSSGMQFIKKADEIASTCSNDFEKVSKIYAWLTDYLDYKPSDDYTAVGAYTCNLDNVYNRGYGVCYDYAVILAAMLRSQGIPCKVVFGKYAGSDYGHVWNEVYINSNGSITTDKVDIIGNEWCRLDPTMSHSNSGKQSTDYMNTDKNYLWQLVY